jgi:hypothetical protein
LLAGARRAGEILASSGEWVAVVNRTELQDVRTL